MLGKTLPRVGDLGLVERAQIAVVDVAEIQAIDGEARSQPAPPPAAFSLFRQSSFEE